MRQSSILSITIQYAITIISPGSEKMLLLFYAYPHFHGPNSLTLASVIILTTQIQSAFALFQPRFPSLAFPQ